MSAENTAYVADALARLIQKFRDKPKIEALVTAAVSPAQDLETALWDLLTLRQVDTAIGAQLDVLGRLVGQPRNTDDDEVYRRYVRARISANKSKGLTVDLLRIARLIVDDPAAAIELDNVGIAAYVLRVLGVAIDNDVATALIRFLKDATAAGVRPVLEYLPADAIETAFWDSAKWSALTGALTPALLTSGNSTIGATFIPTAAVTPTADRAVFAAVVAGSVGATEPTCTGCGLTWTVVQDLQFPSTLNRRVTVFKGTGGVPVNGEVRFDYGVSVITSWVWAVWHHPNTDSTNPVAQVKTAIAENLVPPISATFDNPVEDVTSMTVAVVCQRGSTITKDADFTALIENITEVGELVTLSVIYDVGETTCSCTLNGGGNGGAMILMEVRDGQHEVFAGRADENGVT